MECIYFNPSLFTFDLRFFGFAREQYQLQREGLVLGINS